MKNLQLNEFCLVGKTTKIKLALVYGINAGGGKLLHGVASTT